MKKQILNNILSTPKNNKTFAKVIKPLGNGRYQVQDRSGRKMEVNSFTKWNSGDGVTISPDGRIVDKASGLKVKKKYQV